MVFISLIWSIGEIEARDRASTQNSDSDKVEVALGVLGGSSALLLITTVLLIVMINNRSKRQKSNTTQNEGILFTIIRNIMVILYHVCIIVCNVANCFVGRTVATPSNSTDRSVGVHYGNFK